MRPRTKPRPDAPPDEVILSYDNVPVRVAAQYLSWPEQTVRLALREGRAPFGIAVKDEGLTYKISPGGLVRYKREGIPCFDYETIQNMIRSVVVQSFKEVVKDSVSKTVQEEMSDFRLEFFN